MILLLYIASLAIISTGCFIFGFHILLKDRSSKINRLFFLNSMLLNGVIVFTLLIQFADEAYNAAVLQSIYNIVLILFLLESLYFNIIFTRQKLKPFTALVLSLYALIVFIIFIIRGPDFFELTRVKGVWVYELVNNYFWFLIYSPLLIIIAVLMLHTLYKYSRTAELIKEKKQAKAIMLGILAACSGGFCFLMIFPALNIYRAPLLTPYFFAVYLYGVFYAMIKYKFLSFSIEDIAYEILWYIEDIVIILKPDKTVMDVNNNLSIALPGEPESYCGRNLSELIEYDEEFVIKLDKLIAGEISSFKDRIVYKNEPESIIADASISRVLDNFGDFEAILIVSRENRGIKQFRQYFKITAREMEIVDLAISGITNRDIAEKLQIAERTVEAHLNNIYNKMGINNKIELYRVAGEFSIH